MKLEKDYPIALAQGLAVIVVLFIIVYGTIYQLDLINRASDEGVTFMEMRDHPADRYWVHVTCWVCTSRISYEPLLGQPKEECQWQKECLWCGAVNTNSRHGIPSDER